MAESTVSRLVEMIKNALPTITAVLGLGTAFLGYKTATISHARDQAQTTVTNTTNDLTSLQEKYDTLQAENTRLRAQLGLPGPSADPQASTAATVRHSGHLVVAAGSGADLDSPSSDPQWVSGGTDPGTDIGYSDGNISIYFGAAALFFGDRKADYARCRNTTGYGIHSYDGSASPGKYICVQTSEKRYSALRITQLDSSKVAFDVITYDPPDN